jgi:hypothetical protein
MAGIIIQLMGGLGNQMFQYALGRRLSIFHNVPMKLDISYFETQLIRTPLDTPRNYCLGDFKIKGEVASIREVNQYLSSFSGVIKGRSYRLMQRLLPLSFRRYYAQRRIGFDPTVFKLGKELYLSGFWQSWKYFTDIQETIQSDFSLKMDFSLACLKCKQEIIKTNSVGIHFRRGDYVSNPITQKYHGVCSLEYYYQAAALIATKINDPFFYIFSDDPVWVENNFHIEYPHKIVRQLNDIEDFHLLSSCKHFIIANSSFSWWAAWLATNPEKIVISPNKWFVSEPMNMDDLIPKKWYQIKVN